MTSQRVSSISKSGKSLFRLLIVLSLVIFICSCDSENPKTQQTVDKPIVTAEFTPDTYQKEHQVTAFVESVDQAQLSFQVNGRLSEQWVDIGQQVSQGDPLLQLYNPDLAPQIDRIEAQIQANQAELKQTQLELERNQSLSGIQAISQNQLDLLSSQVKQLEAQQATLRAQLQAANNTYKETTLSAPFTGEVADIRVKSGTMVQAGEPVISLNGSQLFEAPLFISYDLLQNLQLNQELTAYQQQSPLIVTVKEISQSANPDSQLFKVIVEIPPNTSLRSGQKMDVIIPESVTKVYQLPVSAVIDDGINEPYVYQMRGETPHHIQVKVIGFKNNQIWVRIKQESGPIKLVVEGQSRITPPRMESGL